MYTLHSHSLTKLFACLFILSSAPPYYQQHQHHHHHRTTVDFTKLILSCQPELHTSHFRSAFDKFPSNVVNTLPKWIRLMQDAIPLLHLNWNWFSLRFYTISPLLYPHCGQSATCIVDCSVDWWLIQWHLIGAHFPDRRWTFSSVCVCWACQTVNSFSRTTSSHLTDSLMTSYLSSAKIRKYFISKCESLMKLLFLTTVPSEC